MDSHENIFPAFPGDTTHRLAFPMFIKQVLDALEHMGSRDYGLLGYVLTEDEWLELAGNTAPFVPAVAPGNPPPPQPAAPWQEWQYTKQCYDAERKLLNHATAAFVKSLDEHSKSVVEGEEGTIRGKSLQHMIAVLRAEYGTITKNDLLEHLQTLNEPYERGDDILQYLLKHSRGHRTAQHNGQPWPEMLKIATLIAGLTPCGIFTTCIDSFHTAYPALQQQLYSNLQTSVRIYAQNRIEQPTSGTQGYAAAATYVKPPPAASTLSAADVEKMIANALTNMRVDQPRKRTTDKQYCWTHGEQYSHNSAECKTPDQGHDESATLTNRKGGRKNFRDRINAQKKK